MFLPASTTGFLNIGLKRLRSRLNPYGLGLRIQNVPFSSLPLLVCFLKVYTNACPPGKLAFFVQGTKEVFVCPIQVEMGCVARSVPVYFAFNEIDIIFFPYHAGVDCTLIYAPTCATIASRSCELVTICHLKIDLCRSASCGLGYPFTGSPAVSRVHRLCWLNGRTGNKRQKK